MNRIADYALIGDCHSAALVGRDGSIDWACFPCFDSPAIFCAMLDARSGGSWSLAARDATQATRAYLPDTNVLVTTFTTPGGVLEVTDCMPVERSDPGEPRRVMAHAAIMRRARCTAGEVEARVRLAPRFEYGAFLPRFRQTSPSTADIVGGADALYVHASGPVEVTDDAVTASYRLRGGEEVWIDAVWRPSYEPKIQTIDPAEHAREGARRLEATIDYWQSWVARCWYEGIHADAVCLIAMKEGSQNKPA